MNRVVTGYDANGNPTILQQGEPPTVIYAGRYTTTELWVSAAHPQADDTDTSTRAWTLEPPPGGACYRIVEIAPDAGDAGAPQADGETDDVLDVEHAGFQDAHATDTLDYVTILSGEVTLVVGSTELVLGPGDSVIQQPGVPHDWQNRSAAPATMVGVLISGR